MAHTCPECWKHCTCQGDWDDIDFGNWEGCECDCQKFPDMSDSLDEAEQSVQSDFVFRITVKQNRSNNIVSVGSEPHPTR